MSLRRSETSRTARNRFRPWLHRLEDRSVPAVVTSTADAGPGSLRQAIIDTNGSAVDNTITFLLGPTDPGRVYYKDDGLAGRVTLANVTPTPAIATDDDHLPALDPDWRHSWWSIRPLTPLPAITDAVTIDGTTQPSGRPNEVTANFLRVELDGEAAGLASGLVISGGNSVVTGLAINRFGGNGIHLHTIGGNKVVGNFLGTDISGTLDLGNHANGVLVSGGAGNRIGGLTGTPGTGAGNLISGNDDNGISLHWDRIVPRIEGTVVQGNVIGLNAAGTKPLGNTHAGFRTADAGALIGGTDPMARNVISSNEAGIRLSNSGSDHGVVIQGNFIGTDVTGRLARGNTGVGVTVGSAPGTRVGGAEFGAGNVISGNRIGVFIHGISHPTIDGRYNCVVQGNVIGLDVTGTARIDNIDGVIVRNSDNLIGGLTPNPGLGAGNLISGNTENGISVVWDRVLPRLERTVVQGNIIGLDRSGTVPLGNGLAGFRTTDAGAQVGGAVAGARNIISGNQYGVLFSNSGSDRGVVVHGNYIGTDIAGRFAIGNNTGVDVGSAPGTYVGGLMPGEGNVISGNFTGVFIGGISHRVIDGRYNCLVQGNLIGLDALGTGAVPNSDGIRVINNDNLISMNSIAFNRQSGVVLRNSSRNNVMVNDIHHNGRDGISLQNADNNAILMNKSLWNGRDGIRVDALSTGNWILGNMLFFNGEHDAHDDSVGGGRAGTANFWWMNFGVTESRIGLLG
jgi:parallel beta-helix repeat protein